MEISVPVKKTVVREPFIRLVKLVARIFYDNYTTESHNQQKSAKSSCKGTAVVVLEALTREEDLAKDLKIPGKQLRKIIRHFEEQKYVTRYHRKETAKGAKKNGVAVAATTYGRAEDKGRVQVHSYCCLDYSQIYDVVRYKLHRMKKKFKDELEDKDTVQEYGCPNCKRKYNALDALRLISMEDDSFHCENCNGELVMECNKLTSKEVVDGGHNARRMQQENLKDLLQKMEVQFKPLMDQINRIKDLPCPGFESFPAWEARAVKAARENGDLNPNDPLWSQGGYGSTPMPFLGETKVEVNLGEGKEDFKSEGGDNLKVLPPWMIKKGMNLTDKQRGEIRQESKVDGSGSEGAAELSDDKKSAMGNGHDDLKDEYIKAYYAAILKQQELAEKLNQQESAGKLTPDIQLATTSSDRQVGIKSKREEEDEESVEWEEEPPVAANGNNKVDLKVEAETLGEIEGEDDGIDWEEG